MVELEPPREKREVSILETPKDKFNRIHNEFQELRQELESIAQQVILLAYFFISFQGENERHREGNYLPLLLREIETLQQDLVKLDAREGNMMICTVC